MQSSYWSVAVISCEDGYVSFLHSGESMNEEGQDHITADVKWRLSKGNGGLSHNENEHDSHWGQK